MIKFAWRIVGNMLIVANYFFWKLFIITKKVEKYIFLLDVIKLLIFLSHGGCVAWYIYKKVQIIPFTYDQCSHNLKVFLVYFTPSILWISSIYPFQICISYFFIYKLSFHSKFCC